MSDFEVFTTDDGEPAIRMTDEAALAAAQVTIRHLHDEISGYKRELDAAVQDNVDREMAWRNAVAAVRRWYDEAIFPPRPPGPHTEVYDGEAAAVARMTCDNILREYDEARADASTHG